MIGDLPLSAMVHFEAVARLGGVMRAAEELQVSASAVSQQIRLLEQNLGVKLFHREKRHLRLTIDGERLFQTTSQAFQSIREVRAAIIRQRETHNLSVRVSPSFGVRWLAPRLADFCRLQPEWDIRVDATPSFTEFDTEVVDMDLRYGEGDWEGLHTDCIVHDLILPMCSPAYLEKLGRISDDPREQLRHASLIDSVKTYYRWDYWLPRNGVQGMSMSYRCRFDRSSMSVQMAMDNGGIILDSMTLAFEELRRGDLVPFSTVFEVIEFPAYWIVCPHRHAGRRAVRLFSDWVREKGVQHMAQTRQWLEQRGHRTRFERRAAFVASDDR
ncbi:MAG: LysR substrate-binding domain-containing protein [Paracoccus sp. (in: a-proteobacteria)]|uniref:LysR substrate-binding domain-containing protein n=1 Tax=Paracoccus sp. TaxID=267 RepID=UPI0026DF2B25|nr:LysR substrate-binding domain-containing protein [Paracoccus sp. (in: a-proteobacteria)]MDO5630216.1 LysR substrate-binding domain-containing protein [Paracoccus sp. (in: a-proteobacteria)]